MIRSPFMALQMLHAFRLKRVVLTREVYDECFDAITVFLERCNNEQHRLVTLGGDDEKEEV